MGLRGWGASELQLRLRGLWLELAPCVGVLGMRGRFRAHGSGLQLTAAETTPEARLTEKVSFRTLLSYIRIKCADIHAQTQTNTNANNQTDTHTHRYGQRHRHTNTQTRSGTPSHGRKHVNVHIWTHPFLVTHKAW